MDMESFKLLLRPIVRHIKLTKCNAQWRKKNQHNYTVANSIFDVNKVQVGKETYGLLNVYTYENQQEHLTIGNYCCIANEVTFILGGEHHPQFPSNYLFKLHISGMNHADEQRTKGPIIVGDDVWFGYGATILSGVNIGQGAVIAAGTVVSKDVPAYAVYTNKGIVKYRFDNQTINKMKNVDFSKVEYELVRDNIELFYSVCSEKSADKLNLLIK